METNDKDGKEHEDRLAVLNILVNASQITDLIGRQEESFTGVSACLH
jgi:hypothetical protein